MGRYKHITIPCLYTLLIASAADEEEHSLGWWMFILIHCSVLLSTVLTPMIRRRLLVMTLM